MLVLFQHNVLFIYIFGFNIWLTPKRMHSDLNRNTDYSATDSLANCYLTNQVYAFILFNKHGRRDSNSHLAVLETAVLALNYARIFAYCTKRFAFVGISDYNISAHQTYEIVAPISANLKLGLWESNPCQMLIRHPYFHCNKSHYPRTPMKNLVFQLLFYLGLL